jgi:hypothetical protein
MIPNLFVVDQPLNILRGGDPDAAGWIHLADLGIERVIKLNTFAEGSDRMAEALGMKVYRFPIPWWRQVLLRPKEKDLRAVVELIAENTFVHCEAGQDRTSLLVGYFRVLKQGWSKDEAYEEMLAHSFHPALQGLQGRWNSFVP